MFVFRCSCCCSVCVLLFPLVGLLIRLGKYNNNERKREISASVFVCVHYIELLAMAPSGGCVFGVRTNKMTELGSNFSGESLIAPSNMCLTKC